MTEPDWIALDWGTSRVRAWAMSASGAVLASAESGRGMNQLGPADFEPTLRELVSAWLPVSGAGLVIGCGMLGSRQGWIETPYLKAPCAPLGAMLSAPVGCGDFEILICPGVQQELPGDVMRGEETQLGGLLTGAADFDGVVCLPGTHSKWVRVHSGQIHSFRTFLTGELFGLLAEGSVLRHSVAHEDMDRDAFLKAVDESLAAPELLSAKLFSIRADSLLHEQSGAVARARLSGYLIGLELAGARPFWEARAELALVGAGDVTQWYARALEIGGVQARVFPGDDMTLAGLHAAYLELKRPLNPRC